jgi:hypothetical protein
LTLTSNWRTSFAGSSGKSAQGSGKTLLSRTRGQVGEPVRKLLGVVRRNAQDIFRKSRIKRGEFPDRGLFPDTHLTVAHGFRRSDVLACVAEESIKAKRLVGNKQPIRSPCHWWSSVNFTSPFEQIQMLCRFSDRKNDVVWSKPLCRCRSEDRIDFCSAR